MQVKENSSGFHAYNQPDLGLFELFELMGQLKIEKKYSYYTILPVNVPKRKMDDFCFIRKRKFSNSSVINEFYFEEESKKGRFYWADLQVKWY